MIWPQTGNKLHLSLSLSSLLSSPLRLYVLKLLKAISLHLPFSRIENLLISSSSAYCWPVRRVIHLGDDENSRWQAVIPEGLQTVWFSVGVKRKSASHLVIKQANLRSHVLTVKGKKAVWARGVRVQFLTILQYLYKDLLIFYAFICVYFPESVHKTLFTELLMLT